MTRKGDSLMKEYILKEHNDGSVTTVRMLQMKLLEML